MNRSIFLVIFILLSYSLNAQTIVPKIGLSVSTAVVDAGSSDDKSPNLGISFGVGYDFKIGLFSLQPELLFVQKGFGSKSVEEGDGYTLTQTNKYTFNYIEIPLMMKVSFGNETLKFHINTGPSISVGVGGKHKYKSIETNFLGDFVAEVSEEKNIKFGEAPFSNKTDFGIQIGTGVTILNKVILDIRYGHAFSNHHDNVKSKHRAVQFTIGVPLQL